MGKYILFFFLLGLPTNARLFRDFVKPYFKGLGMGDLGDGGGYSRVYSARGEIHYGELISNTNTAHNRLFSAGSLKNSLKFTITHQTIYPAVKALQGVTVVRYLRDIFKDNIRKELC